MANVDDCQLPQHSFPQGIAAVLLRDRNGILYITTARTRNPVHETPAVSAATAGPRKCWINGPRFERAATKRNRAAPSAPPVVVPSSRTVRTIREDDITLRTSPATWPLATLHTPRHWRSLGVHIPHTCPRRSLGVHLTRRSSQHAHAGRPSQSRFPRSSLRTPAAVSATPAGSLTAGLDLRLTGRHDQCLRPLPARR